MRLERKPPEYLIRLAKELRTIWDDREYVEGTAYLVRSEEDCNTMLEFIRNGENVTVETVCIYPSFSAESARNWISRNQNRP